MVVQQQHGLSEYQQNAFDDIDFEVQEIIIPDERNAEN